MAMRFATPFVTVCFVMLALGSQQARRPAAAANATPLPGGTLVALLAKSRAASGAPYRYHIVSRSQESHDGTTFNVTTEFQGLKYRAESCSHALCTGFYFDGERSFNTNFNDTALPVTAGVDGLQITLRAIASYAFTDPAFVADGGTLVEREPVLRDGKKFRRISVAPRLGALLDAIVDPSTGLVVGVISDERKYAFEFRDQRRIGGNVTLPFSISLNGYTFTTYERRSIASTDLEAPAGVLPDFGTGDGIVPMQKHDTGNAPLVACTIGGEPITCLLDTSDSGLSMSLSLARKLDLKPLGGSFDEHGAGRYVSGVADAPALTVGTTTYPKAHYVVLHDLSQSGYDVILGADAFAHARITLDFRKRVVTIAPSGTEAGGLPITFDDFTPVLATQLDGQAALLRLDTGDDGAIALSRDFVDRQPALANASGTIGTVRIGTYTLKNVPVDTHEKLPYDGRIGSAPFDTATLTLDYARGTISLIAR